ncbi:MAG: thioredoxin family protein [Leptolyngbyaceae cyanobacterium SL_7_1]|nr:thioredoxin family protein [Leptolyngbyaceae cyanobacterium SL_7_1]
MAILPSSVRRFYQLTLGLVLVGLLVGWAGVPIAHAGLTDDHYDGNMFALYAGNGSIVPPRITLAQALARPNPTMLFFYVDDSQDCKQYSTVMSRVDAFYGRAIDIIALNVDTIPVKASYEPTEAGYYLSGYVPQVVLFDQSSNVVLNERGAVPYEKMDDILRELFDLLPRSQSEELKRRPINEINTELVPQTK